MNILQDRYAYFFSLEDFPVGSTIDPIEHHFNEEGVKEKLEETLESIRKSKYRDFPSRLKCTFVAPTEDSANEWCKSAKSKHWASQGCHLEYYIYKVMGISPFYWFNADILMQIFWPGNKDVKEVSEEYWSSYSAKKLISSTFDIEGLTDDSLIILDKKKMCLDHNRIFKEVSV